MNDLQENKLTMYEAVKALLDQRNSIVSTIAAIQRARLEFAQLLETIKSKSQEQLVVTAGKRAEKEEAEDALIRSLMEMSSAVYTYGRAEKDNELKAVANVSESKLRRMRDTELVKNAEAIYQKAADNIANLADYGITNAKVVDLKSKIDEFNLKLGIRESSAAERVETTSALIKLFSDADEVLNDGMDKLVELIRNTHTEFYNEYFAARVIKDLGVRKRVKEPIPPAP